MVKILHASSPVATVFGGSGFVGKYIVRRLVKCGWRVRVAVRKPNEALFLKTYGEVGQVDVFECSAFNPIAVSSCIPGSKLVINCIAGPLNETAKKQFKRYYVEAPALIAEQCSKLGVEKFIHISSVGVDRKSMSIYSSSKARGEENIKRIFTNTIIIRPSLIFGHEDSFFNRYASIAVKSVIVPLIGGNTKFQPVYVDDVALAVEKIAIGEDLMGVFELCGPEILTFKQLIEKMLYVIRRKRVIFSIPVMVANLMAVVFEFINKVTLGLGPVPFTRDNVLQLREDNVFSNRNKSFEDLKIIPKNIDTIIPLYLYSYRPHGQYNDTIVSAKK